MLLDRFKLDGRVAIISGGGRGIGRAISLVLAEAGASVCVAARTAEEVEATADEARALGASALAQICDVNQEDQLDAMVAHTREALGPVSVLINVAGGSLPCPAMNTTAEEFEQSFHFNVTTAFQLTQKCVPQMRSLGGGAVVNISSALSHLVESGFVSYGTAKAALSHMTRLLAYEFAPLLRVNAIAAGAIETEALKPFLATDGLKDKMETMTPMARLGTPEDVALAALYLASPASAWVTGKIFEIDGGTVASNWPFKMPAFGEQPMPGEPGSRGSKARGLAQVTLAYVAGLAAAIGTGVFLREQHPLLMLGAADLAGTLVVFGFSVAHDNTSVYDPYWSVAPIPIALYLAWLGWEAGPPAARVAAVVLLVALWGNRLTYSWARGWPGLHHEDWRYNQARPKAGSLYWPFSFLAFQLFPTLIVFAGCLPLYPALTVGDAPLGWLDGVALVVTLGAVWFEATADRQLNRHVRSSPTPGSIFEGGLWAYSRHPNYFGEVGFWYGLYLFGLAAAPIRALWWIAAGPALMTLLFLFVSIPLIERRMLASRPDYPERLRRVSRIIPWFPGR